MRSWGEKETSFRTFIGQDDRVGDNIFDSDIFDLKSFAKSSSPKSGT